MFLDRLVSRSRVIAGIGLSLLAALAITGCGGSATANNVKNTASSYGTVISGKLPVIGTAIKGGRITFGQLTGQTPTYIFPIIPAAPCAMQTFNFISQQYLPLYYGPEGARPEIDESQSAAELPTYSNDDKTVTINIKPGLKWSDGKPVDANDVIFYFDLLKAGLAESESNWCQFTPHEIPENIASWTATSKNTVVLQLKHSVNPTWFTTNQLQDTNGGVYPIPSEDWNIASAGGAHLDYSIPANATKIYNYLNHQGSTLGTFATNPLWKVVDGPFKLKDFSAIDDSYDLVPNLTYSLSPKPQMDEVSYVTYTSATAQLNALQDSSLDIAQLDAGTEFRAIPTLERDGYSVFGAPVWGWFGGYINFKNTTDNFDKVVAQPYIRGVFAELVNQPAIIKGVYHGWAVAAYGPVPSSPYSPFVPSDVSTDPYPFNPAKAVTTLKAHGWKVVPNGQTTCAKPGTAADECGAGIPAGTPLKIVWADTPQSVSSTGQLEAEVFASQAKESAGINVQLITKSTNLLDSAYSNVASTKYTNDWGVNNVGGVNTNFYPTEDGILSVGGSLNFGSYNDPVATRLMDASQVSPSKQAIAQEVRYFATSYPIFWMPDADQIYAISNRVGGPNDAFLALTQMVNQPQYMYLTKR